MPDWHQSPDDREFRALVERLEVYAYAASTTLAVAWFVIPALAAWLGGATP